MTADCIMVMRHAQKPRDKPPESGVREDGAADPESLSVEGWQRAGALAALFGGPAAHLTILGLVRPDRVFASGRGTGKSNTRDGRKVGSHSRRPEQTVTPLARRLGRPAITRYLRGEEESLIADIMREAGAALICWQHEEIPRIGELIMGAPGRTPSEWPEDCYSNLWIFSRRAGGWDFRLLSLPLIEAGAPSSEGER